MPNKDVSKIIIDEIKRHYNETDRPYYLADLGLFFRDHNLEIPKGVRFMDFLKVRFEGLLNIVQDPDTPAKIAIATPEKSETVLRQLIGEPFEGSDTINFDLLSYALLAAFCKVSLPGNKVFFRTRWPFHYKTGPEAHDDTYVEIDEEFQPSDLRGVRVDSLRDDQKKIIIKHIVKWAAAKSIDLRTLYYDQSFVRGSDTEHNEVASNALQRLINAQDPELRDKFRIPGDIASILMRTP